MIFQVNTVVSGLIASDMTSKLGDDIEKCHNLGFSSIYYIYGVYNPITMKILGSIVKSKDPDMKKFITIKFLDSKIIDSRNVMRQV